MDKLHLKLIRMRRTVKGKSRESRFTANQTRIVHEHVTDRQETVSAADFQHEHETLLETL